MKLRTIRRTAVLIAIAASLGALADKTVTYLTSGATVESMCVYPVRLQDGGATQVNIQLCAHATIQGNGNSPTTCYNTANALSAANSAGFLTAMNGPGLTFWKAQEGL